MHTNDLRNATTRTKSHYNKLIYHHFPIPYHSRREILRLDIASGDGVGDESLDEARHDILLRSRISNLLLWQTNKRDRRRVGARGRRRRRPGERDRSRPGQRGLRGRAGRRGRASAASPGRCRLLPLSASASASGLIRPWETAGDRIDGRCFEMAGRIGCRRRGLMRLCECLGPGRRVLHAKGGRVSERCF